MKTFISFLIISLLSSVSVGSDITYLTPETYKGHTSTGTVVVEFWAPWNQQNGLSQEEITEIKSHGVEVYRVDIANYPSLSKKYNVPHLPEFIFYKDGEEVNRLHGNARFLKTATTQQIINTALDYE